MDNFILQFSTTSVWQSGGIRVLTRSPYSHVDLVIPPGIEGLDGLTPRPYGLLGASDPGGVLIRPPHYHEFKIRRRMTIKSDKTDAFIKTMAGEIGMPFDFENLYRAFDPNWKGHWTDNGRWYCSELVTWALLEVDFWDYGPYPISLDLAGITPLDLIQLLCTRYDPVEWNQEVTDQ